MIVIGILTGESRLGYHCAYRKGTKTEHEAVTKDTKKCHQRGHEQQVQQLSQEE